MELPVSGNIFFERVRFSGWVRDYREKEMHPLPIVGIPGFDVPVLEERNIRLPDCAAEAVTVAGIGFHSDRIMKDICPVC